VNRYSCCFVCFLSLVASIPLRVMSSEAGVPQSLEPVKTVVERDVFAGKPARPSAQPETPPKPSSDSLVLFGTMSSRQGQFAFFDGSNPDFRMVLRPGERIGGCVLTEVAFTKVKLRAGELEFELPVGTCLIRGNAGQWKLGGDADEAPPPVKATSPGTQSPDSRHAGKVVAEEKAFADDPDEYAKWVAKKLSKYFGEMNPDGKKEKHSRKTPDAFFEHVPRKPGKPDKHG
jgi:hypothetical protein